jgi:RNA polymerase sigma-54 factor
MAMKPVLALRMGQQLRMTPQLQQAIKLLQLSTFDLQQEIQEALDSNLMLEEASDSENGEEPTSLDTPEETIEGLAAESNAEGSKLESSSEGSDQVDFDEPPPPNPELDGDTIPDTSDQIASESITDDLPVDSVWEDVWDDSPSGSYSGTDEDGDNYLENQNSSSPSLQTHLEEQLSLINLSETDQMIAMAIIDGLDENGVMTITLDDVMQSLPHNPEDPIETDEIEAVLHLIQHLDPVGVSARDLSECLTIQLNQLPPLTPWRSEALLIVKDHLSSLANRDYAYLIRKTRLKEPELKAVITLIQTLNPRPGSDFNQTRKAHHGFVSTRTTPRW